MPELGQCFMALLPRRSAWDSEDVQKQDLRAGKRGSERMMRNEVRFRMLVPVPQWESLHLDVLSRGRLFQ